MSSNIVVMDAETTTRNMGNPFDPNNRLCSVGILDNGNYFDYPIEYGNSPYGDNLGRIYNHLLNADVIVGFNIKFDLHWIRNYIDINYHSLCPIWDCSLGEYLLSNQTRTFPSLDETCSNNGLGNKLDIVASQYWANGIDTPDIPYDILSEYLKQDVLLTHKLYALQESCFKQDPKLFQLFKVGNEDLKWLAEAERNGMLFNVEESKAIAEKLSKEKDAITCQLCEIYECPHIDWDSSDHISIVLYGGILYYTGRETYIKELKAGPVERERNAWLPWEFKGQLKPDPRTQNAPLDKIKDDELEETNNQRIAERKKPFVRTYSVAEGILRNYTPRGKTKKTIDLLLKRAELTKLISTYYEGIPAIMEKHDWTILHGTFNQVGTRTGRLSSSKPNLQNFAGDIKPLFLSRYASS